MTKFTKTSPIRELYLEGLFFNPKTHRIHCFNSVLTSKISSPVKAQDFRDCGLE